MSYTYAKTGASIPVIILGGFLGSGKTTLLARLLAYYQERGMKPAVIMNELGDAGLAELPAGMDVPVKELLSGCICCTMKADLAGELMLLANQQPDVILVEATGAANPLELMEGVMEASMSSSVHLAAAVTVVDGAGLLQLRKGSRRTYRLLLDGVRCATRLVLNKCDRLYPEELVELQQQLRELNPYAELVCTEHSKVDSDWLGGLLDGSGQAVTSAEVRKSEGAIGSTSCGCESEHNHTCESHGHDHGAQSHEHLMAVSFYPDTPFDSGAFEAMLNSLPDTVYRVKGIVTFSDTPSRYQLQYAFKEADFMPLPPEYSQPDVLVFIGEHFSRNELIEALSRLDGG